MSMRRLPVPALAVSLCFPYILAASAPAKAWEIPFSYRNGLIVVKGSYGKTSGLRFIVDTGATCSLLDRPLTRKMGLRQESSENSLQAFGQVMEAKRFYLPGLILGPVFTTLHCLEADLSLLMVDGIIGLDLLRRKTYLACCKTHEVIPDKNFTIDFESRTIRFSAGEPLPNSVALEVGNSRIVVPIRIYGRVYRLALDTGSNVIMLFRASSEDWGRSLLRASNLDIALVGGQERKKEVLLPPLEMGADRWDFLNGIVKDAAGQPLDGVLAVTPLRLKKLHIDFDRNLLSWSR